MNYVCMKLYRMLVVTKQSIRFEVGVKRFLSLAGWCFLARWQIQFSDRCEEVRPFVNMGEGGKCVCSLLFVDEDTVGFAHEKPIDSCCKSV